MAKALAAFVAVVLISASQVGCRSCGGCHLDYGSPVSGCACNSCKCSCDNQCHGSCRSGSAWSAESASIEPTHAPPEIVDESSAYDYEEGSLIQQEAPGEAILEELAPMPPSP